MDLSHVRIGAFCPRQPKWLCQTGNYSPLKSLHVYIISILLQSQNIYNMDYLLYTQAGLCSICIVQALGPFDSPSDIFFFFFSNLIIFMDEYCVVLFTLKFFFFQLEGWMNRDEA